MKILTIDELIDHCNRQLDRLPSGTNGYQEHESVRAYLQELRHFRSLGVSFDKLRDLVEECGEGKFVRVEAMVGETVWVIQPNMTVMPFWVEIVHVYDNGNRSYCCHGQAGVYCFDEEKFGDTVFHTPEEAKAKVEELLRGVK